jgi:hypothetical protein
MRRPPTGGRRADHGDLPAPSGTSLIVSTAGPRHHRPAAAGLRNNGINGPGRDRRGHQRLPASGAASIRPDPGATGADHRTVARTRVSPLPWLRVRSQVNGPSFSPLCSGSGGDEPDTRVYRKGAAQAAPFFLRWRRAGVSLRVGALGDLRDARTQAPSQFRPDGVSRGRSADQRLRDRERHGRGLHRPQRSPRGARAARSPGTCSARWRSSTRRRAWRARARSTRSR